MPELPEVITVVDILKSEVIGKTLKTCHFFYPKLLKDNNTKEFVDNIKNQSIKNVTNRAKFILFELDDFIMISHLRMEGRWAIEEKAMYAYSIKNLEVEFALDDNLFLRYYDLRRFGTLELIHKSIDWKKYLDGKVGPEANNKKITAEWLSHQFQNVKKPIKVALLDQKIISGIGNIYANEILFAAKINPYIPANALNLEQLSLILKKSQDILNKAIEMKGTTIHSFEPKHGMQGGYQKYLRVHMKNHKPCINCQEKIIKVQLGGRGTYYCQNCQK